jgi:hypothetical protein
VLPKTAGAKARVPLASRDSPLATSSNSEIDALASLGLRYSTFRTTGKTDVRSVFDP